MLYYVSLLSYGFVALAFDFSHLQAAQGPEQSEVKTTPLGMAPGIFGLGLRQSVREVRTCMTHQDCNHDEFCRKLASDNTCEASSEGECAFMRQDCSEEQKFDACGCDGHMYKGPCSFAPYTRMGVLKMGTCPVHSSHSSMSKGKIVDLQHFVPSDLQNIKAPAAPFSLPSKAGLCIKDKCGMESQQCYNDNFCTAVMGCVDRCSTDGCARDCLSTNNGIYADQVYRCAIQKTCFGQVEYVTV